MDTYGYQMDIYPAIKVRESYYPLTFQVGALTHENYTGVERNDHKMY